MDRCPECGGEMLSGGCLACDWTVVLHPSDGLSAPVEGALSGLEELIRANVETSGLFWLYVGEETFRAHEARLRKLGDVHLLNETGIPYYGIRLGG